MTTNDPNSPGFDAGSDDALRDENAAVLNDAGLARLAQRLDALAAAERGLADAGLEARLWSAVTAAGRDAAMDATPPLRPLAAHAPLSSPWRESTAARTAARWSLRPGSLRLAAAVGLAATLGALWIGTHRTPAARTAVEYQAIALEQDVDQWLDMPGIVGDEFEAELAALQAEAASLSRGSRADWSSTEAWPEDGAL